MITRVCVPAKWLQDDGFQGVPRHAIADFTLGVGPCGKTVEGLDVEYGQHALVVSQRCSDGEAKQFVYPWHTVTGRVEVTHG